MTALVAFREPHSPLFLKPAAIDHQEFMRLYNGSVSNTPDVVGTI
jgi:hypothetical protein